MEYPYKNIYMYMQIDKYHTQSNKTTKPKDGDLKIKQERREISGEMNIYSKKS